MADSKTAPGTKDDFWTAKSYQNAASFVPAAATKVLAYLDPQPEDVILDIGCGDGMLNDKIAASCKRNIGLDASPGMLEAANNNIKPKHTNLEFVQIDCRRLIPDACATQTPEARQVLRENCYDKVFSSATLHWVLRDEECRVPFFSDVHWLLKPGGVFVFEQGGFGNVADVHTALYSVLRLKYNIPMKKIMDADPWFYPSTTWMTQTLEAAGFNVEVMETEHRPSQMTASKPDGSGGVEGWIRLMGARFLELLPEQEQDDAVASVSEMMTRVITRVEDGSQWLNYVRLRVVARKNQ